MQITNANRWGVETIVRCPDTQPGVSPAQQIPDVTNTAIFEVKKASQNVTISTLNATVTITPKE